MSDSRGRQPRELSPYSARRALTEQMSRGNGGAAPTPVPVQAGGRPWAAREEKGPTKSADMPSPPTRGRWDTGPPPQSQRSPSAKPAKEASSGPRSLSKSKEASVEAASKPRHREASPEPYRKPREHSREKKRDRSRERHRDRSKDRRRDDSRDRKRDRSKDRRRDRSRDKDADRRRDRSRDKEADRDGVKERKRERSRERRRDRSRDTEKDRRRDRSRDTDKDRRLREKNGDRKRDRSKDRHRHRSRSTDRRRDRSPIPYRSKRRTRSPSRSASPPPKRSKRTRSPSPAPRSKKPLPSQELSFRGTDNSAQPPTKYGGAPTTLEKPNFKPTGLLAKAANKVDGTKISLKYHEPPEARKPPPSQPWRLFVFKGPDVVDSIELHTRSCWLLGRAREVVDYVLEHPSSSAQHAVIQFRYVQKTVEDEFGVKKQRGKVKPYMIDLESSNGTELNGERVETSRYLELRDKDILKFAGSEREYVVMLPPAEEK